MNLKPRDSVLLMLLLALAPAAEARDAASADWTNLKTIPAGSELRVRTKDANGPLRGELRSVTDSSLVMFGAAAEQSLDRNSIVEVQMKSTSHRLRNTLIGTAVGAGGGLAIGAAIDIHGCPSHTNCFGLQNIGKEVLTPAGALLGALIGVLIPTGRWHQVYRVP